MSNSPPPRRSHKDRREESDRKIIQAAIELFAENGYQKTTLIQIGELAGYTGTLISNRFGSKDRLLRAVLAHILVRFQATETGPDKNISASKQLANFVAAYLLDVTKKQSRIRALYVIMGEALGSISNIQNDIIKVNVVFRERISEFIQAGLDNGEFKPGINVATEAIIIVGLLRGVTMQILAEPNKIKACDLINSVQDSVLAKLTLKLHT